MDVYSIPLDLVQTTYILEWQKYTVMLNVITVTKNIFKFLNTFHFSASCACLKIATGRSLLPTGSIFSHMQGAHIE